MADNLGEQVTDRTLVLNLVRSLNEKFANIGLHLRHSHPFPRSSRRRMCCSRRSSPSPTSPLRPPSSSPVSLSHRHLPGLGRPATAAPPALAARLRKRPRAGVESEAAARRTPQHPVDSAARAARPTPPGLPSTVCGPGPFKCGPLHASACADPPGAPSSTAAVASAHGLPAGHGSYYVGPWRHHTAHQLLQSHGKQ